MSAKRHRRAWDTASGGAGEKALLDRAGVKLAADENEPAFALLIGLPLALVIAVEHHVHALQHEALRVVLEREDSFATENLRAFPGDEIVDPWQEFFRIQGLFAFQRQ